MCCSPAPWASDRSVRSTSAIGATPVSVQNPPANQSRSVRAAGRAPANGENRSCLHAGDTSTSANWRSPPAAALPPVSGHGRSGTAPEWRPWAHRPIGTYWCHADRPRVGRPPPRGHRENTGSICRPPSPACGAARSPGRSPPETAYAANRHYRAGWCREIAFPARASAHAASY